MDNNQAKQKCITLQNIVKVFKTYHTTHPLKIICDTIFDENGYAYSTKLVKCKHCGRLNVIRYFEDDSMKLNNDRKYYDYDMV